MDSINTKIIKEASKPPDILQEMSKNSNSPTSATPSGDNKQTDCIEEKFVGNGTEKIMESSKLSAIEAVSFPEPNMLKITQESSESPMSSRPIKPDGDNIKDTCLGNKSEMFGTDGLATSEPRKPLKRKLIPPPLPPNSCGAMRRRKLLEQGIDGSIYTEKI